MNHLSFDQLVQTSILLPGWASPEKVRTLAALTYALRPTLAVEIGIFAGRSALPVIGVMADLKAGTFYGIDPWSPAYSIVGQTDQHQAWWQSSKLHSEVRSLFFETLDKYNLRDVVEIFEKASDDVDPLWSIDLLHVDGNHSEQSIRDVKRYASRVRVGGIVVVDDLLWDNGGPSKAVQELGGMGFGKLYEVVNKPDGGPDDWAVYQRMRA